MEKLSLYLHDEFAALAAKLENRPQTGGATGNGEALAEIRGQLAALQNRPGASADSPALLEMLNQSMNRLSAEVDAKLTLLNSKLEKNMETRWSDALSSINTLREQIEDLSSAGEQMKSINQNMTSLSRLMMARSGADEHGARQQLSELLTQILSPRTFCPGCGFTQRTLRRRHGALSRPKRFGRHRRRIVAGVFC